jgi:hypothetical protein
MNQPRAIHAARVSLLGLGLLFAVALGSRAVPLSSAASDRSASSLPANLTQYLALLAAPVALATIIALMLVLIPQGRSGEGEDEGPVSTFPRMRPWLRAGAIAMVVGMMAVPVAVAIWASGASTDQPLPGPIGSLGASPAGVSQPPRTSAAPFHWSWIPVAIVATTAGFGLVAFVAGRRSRPATVRAAVSSATRVRRGLIDSIAALRAEADPRRAVVAAYARMEHDLSTLGISRRISETAPEYLDRLLLRLDVSPSSAVRLTDLFERARFGHRPVDSRMKSEAIESLEQVVAELAEVG